MSTIRTIRKLVTLISFVLLALRTYKYLKQTGVLTKLSTSYRELQQLREINPAIEINNEVPKTVAKVKKKLKSNVKQLSKITNVVKLPIATEDKSDRISQIRSFAKNKRKFTLAEIRDSFPTVTTRTLRRDLDRLEQGGILVQEGKTRGSFYALKNNHK